MGPPFRPHRDGVRVQVKAMPGARKEGVLGVELDGKGEAVLKVALSAPPEAGKANRALILLLAKEWGVAKSAISVVMGATQRRKVLEIRGPARDVEQRLLDWLAQMQKPEQPQ
jgi:uncharacterized protein (TIGR00251 family)